MGIPILSLNLELGKNEVILVSFTSVSSWMSVQHWS